MPRKGSERPQGTRQLNVDVTGSLLDAMEERRKDRGLKQREAVEEAITAWLSKAEDAQAQPESAGAAKTSRRNKKRQEQP